MQQHTCLGSDAFESWGRKQTKKETAKSVWQRQTEETCKGQLKAVQEKKKKKITEVYFCLSLNLV